MRFIKHLTTWLLLLTVITASGIVSAKVASGSQNLSGGLHQENIAANALMHLAKIDFSYDDASGSPVVPKSAPHKNSLNYVGETHVYRVKGPNGNHKIGESAQGTRVGDGASIRAEQQARRLTRQTGDRYSTDIRKTFPDKRSARQYETKLIERFRRRYGQDSLPGNKTNR